MENNSRFVAGSIIAGIVLVVAFILFIMSITSIQPGYVGVVYDRTGGLDKETLKPGWHLISPLKKVTEYPVSTETVHYEDGKAFSIATKDGKVVKAEIMYSYHMDEGCISEVFAKFRGKEIDEISSTYMKDRLAATIQNITSTYGVLEVYGDKRGEINEKVFQTFKTDLHHVGITVETFNFSKIEPDAESLKAIQSLVDSQLKLEQLKIEKEQAVVTAEKNLVVAEGEAKAKIAAAEGEATANKKLQATLNPNIINYEMAKKWDGKYPQVVGGNTITNLPGLTGSTSSK